MYEELKKVGQDGYFLYLHYRYGLYPHFYITQFVNTLINIMLKNIKQML